MQVAQQSQHVTHAVLGGTDNISFGISDDPAFFQILSSALYKDPMLAMIRETICNAWDAHIDAGRTDMPLKITLDGEKLIIRDYGKGIPHDKIGPVYAVYGASTKKNDGRQTGGFGLGCKSPFAYTDHFEVVSFHDGVRTIYNMSKSSAEKMGKPSVTKIASFPTTETGIQITIDLKNDGNDYRMDGLIRQVVFNGDIKAMFNEHELPVLGLDKTEHGFMLLNDQAQTLMPTRTFEHNRVFVRYGNVIYPVERAEEINGLRDRVSNMLDRIYNCRLIMMAPADSISMTPSRESLTMSELTVKTLTELMSNFLATLMQNRALSHRYAELANEYVDKAAVEEFTPIYDKLNVQTWKVPGVPDHHENKFISTTEDMAALEVLLRYSGRTGAINNNTWVRMFGRYLNKMVEAEMLPRGLTKTWLNTARRAKNLLVDPYRSHRSWYTEKHGPGQWSEVQATTQWWRKRVMVPLVQKLMDASPLIKPDMISYMSTNLTERRHLRGVVQPKPVQQAWLTTHTANLIHLVMPTVVVCHNTNLIARRMNHVRTNKSSGTYRFGTYFVVELPRTKGETEKVMDMLAAIQGIELIDLTGRLEHEEQEYQDRLSAQQKKRAAYASANPDMPAVSVKKIRKAGLVRFDALLGQKHNKIDTTVLINAIDPVRTTTPAFIVKVSTAAEQTFVTDTLDAEVAHAVAVLYGKEGAVTNNSGVMDRQLEKGVMDIDPFLADRLLKEMSGNAEIAAYMEYNPNRAEGFLLSNSGSYHRAQEILSLYKVMISVAELHPLVPGFVPLSDENQMRLLIWRQLQNTHRWRNQPDLVALTNSLTSIELCDEARELLDKLTKNPLLGLLDVGHLDSLVTTHRADQTRMTQLASVITTLIN